MMYSQDYGSFPTELGRLIDEALERQINHRRHVEAWAQFRKDREALSTAEGARRADR